VGYHSPDATSPSLHQTLIELWNGTGWSIVGSPNTQEPFQSLIDNVLDGVSCVSAVNCTAVGYWVGSGGYSSTLIESWNGSTWSIVPSPGNPQAGRLNGVACVSVNFCAAVGSDYSYAVAQPLADSWNGTSWSKTSNTTANGALGSVVGGYLTAVSCASAAFCSGVGYFTNAVTDPLYPTLTESWNGSTWKLAPAPPIAMSQLTGVSCVSPKLCTAVGYQTSVHNQTLVESWDGIAWAIIPSPDQGTAVDNQLYGISCITSAKLIDRTVSAGSCTAVGSAGNIPDDQTLIEHGP
jgi:hypothetical protein